MQEDDTSLMDTLDHLAAQAGGHLEQIYKFRDKLMSSDTPSRASPPVPTSFRKSTSTRQNQFNYRSAASHPPPAPRAWIVTACPAGWLRHL